MENEKLIKKVNTFMIEKHLTRAEFCEACDISESTLSTFLRGFPTHKSTLAKIKKTLTTLSVYHLDLNKPHDVDKFVKTISFKRIELEKKIDEYEKELEKMKQLKANYDTLLGSQQKPEPNEQYEGLALNLEGEGIDGDDNGEECDNDNEDEDISDEDSSDSEVDEENISETAVCE